MTIPADAASVDDESEQDYQALYKIEKAKNAAITGDWKKMGKDLSSLKGSVRSQTARDDALSGRFDAIDKKIEAMGDAQASGDVSTLAESLTRITGESDTVAVQHAFKAEYEELHGDLQEALGKISLDAPEATEIKALWMEGYSDQTLSGSKRITLFNKAIRMADKLTPAKPEDPAPDPEEGDKDDLGTDTGPGSPGASKTLASLLKKNPMKMTSAERKQHEKDLYTEAGKEMGVKFKLE